MPNKYVLISPGNYQEIALTLNTQGGSILFAQPGRDSFNDNVVDAVFDLFQNPRIDKNLVVADSAGWRTPGSRQYRLFRTPGASGDANWDSLRDLFEKIDFSGKYLFQIAGQHTSSRGYIDRIEQGSFVVYIPADTPVSDALILSCLDLSRGSTDRTSKTPLIFNSQRRIWGKSSITWRRTLKMGPSSAKTLGLACRLMRLRASAETHIQFKTKTGNLTWLPVKFCHFLICNRKWCVA